MIENLPRSIAAVSAAAVLLLSSCEPQVRGRATPEAAEQFAQIADAITPAALPEWETDQLDSINKLISHFAKTADTRYALPPDEGAYTMLHLACYFKKPELARCLLLDGADPNARAMDKDMDGRPVPGDVPLSFALTEYGTQPDTQAILQLLDILVQGGADLTQTGPGGSSLFVPALSQSSEEVFLKFLDLGAPLPDSFNALGYNVPIAAGPAMRGWLNALKRVISEREKQSDTDQALQHVLRYAVLGCTENTEACIRYLLSRGADVNQISEDGYTPLYAACRLYYELRHGMGALTDDVGTKVRCLETVITLLLNSGADPMIRRPDDDTREYPGFSAADFLANSPDFVDRLEQAGITLPEPDPNFTTGIPLLSEICRRAMNPDFKLREQDYDAVASVLTPTQEMQNSELYEMALPKAIGLLADLDSARTATLLTSIPLWHHNHPHSDTCDCGHYGPTLIEAISEHPSLVMPSAFLISEAERRLDEGESEWAAELIELLYRCPDAEEQISTLLQDPRLPIQAGAWGAKLRAMGLPTPRAESVKHWLAAHHREANTPILQKALRLTSQEDFWYGRMEQAQLTQFLRDLQDIGASRAHALYQKLAQNLDNPEKLDEISTRISDATYELEIATARFIHQNASAFTDPGPAAPTP